MNKQKIYFKHFLLVEQEKALYSSWLKEKGFTFEQFQTMCYLWDKREGEEIGLVADALTIPRQTMTHMADALEKRELLLRKRATNDRRKIHIIITEHGAEIFSALSNQLWAYEESALKTISKQELEVFNDVHSRIVNGLAQAFSKGIEEV